MSKADKDETTLANPTSLIQSRTIELLDNGKLAGSAVVGDDGRWQVPLENLTEGLHTLTASGGGVVSPAWNINVPTRSGSEEWSGINEKTIINRHTYFTNSGLIFFGRTGQTSNPNAFRFIRLPEGDLTLELPHSNQTALLCIILPVDANRFTITLGRAVVPGTTSLFDFYTTENVLERAKYPTEAGDNEYRLSRSARYIYINHREWGGRSLYIKKISWSSAV